METGLRVRQKSPETLHSKLSLGAQQIVAEGTRKHSASDVIVMTLLGQGRGYTSMHGKGCNDRLVWMEMNL